MPESAISGVCTIVTYLGVKISAKVVQIIALNYIPLLNKITKIIKNVAQAPYRALR